MHIGKILGRLATVVGMFFLYSLAQVIVLMPALVSDGHTAWWLDGILFLLVFGALIYFCVTVYHYFLRSEGPRVYHNQRLNRPRVKFLVLMILALVAVQALNYVLVRTGITHEAENQIELMKLMKTATVPMVLLTVLGAPPVEEFIFRGLLMHAFPHQATVRWRWFAGVVSVVAFATAHTMPTDFWNWLLYAGMGAVFTATYAYTKDIRYDIGLHFLNNLVATFLP